MQSPTIPFAASHLALRPSLTVAAPPPLQSADTITSPSLQASESPLP
jgi:hypothetical protein